MQIEKAAATKRSSNLSILNENISHQPLQISKMPFSTITGQTASYDMPDASPSHIPPGDRDLITAGERQIRLEYLSDQVDEAELIQ